MQGPMLKEGMLCTDQDSLTGGLSRESSTCCCLQGPLAAAVREGWVGPASYPLHDAVAEEGEQGEEGEQQQRRQQEQGPEAAGCGAEEEDEYEGTGGGGAGSSDEYSDVEGAGGHTEVVYCKEGVCVFPSARQRILGRLSLVKQYRCLFLCWLPYAAGAAPAEDVGAAASPATSRQAAGDAGGGSGGGGSSSGGVESARDRSMYAIHPIPLSDIRAIRKHTPALGQHSVTLTLASGVSLPSLVFMRGGVKAFLSCLREHVPLVRSAEDPGCYLVNDTGDPLQRSLCSLELADVLIGGPPAGASSTFPPFAGPLAGGQWQGAEGELGLLAELADRFQSLAQTARDTASSLFAGSMLLGAGGWQAEDGSAPAPAAAAGAPGGGGEAAGGAGPAAAEAEAEAAAAGERRRSSLEACTPLGVFELIESGSGGAAAAGASPLWTRAPPPPLSLAELNAFYDAEGRLTSPAAFRERVRLGGIEPEARPEAWRHLLGVHPQGAGFAERAAAAAERQRRYAALREQWHSMDGDQAGRCSKWRERRARIDKDVRRTDRGHRFFARERSQAHAMLRGLLLSYERYNQDLGYVQGMSDLAAPLVYVMRSALPSGQLGEAEALAVEAEAFWAFQRLMHGPHGGPAMEPNFSPDSRSMHAQLEALRQLLRLLDPPLYAHLEKHDSLNMFFCYRWLLILFKRELPFDEVLRLWEALWAGTRGLHLYMCVAVLEHHRRTILSEACDFDSMLRFAIELSGRLKLEPLLRDAELLASYAGEAGRQVVAAAMEA